jgi:hypothetical protein
MNDSSPSFLQQAGIVLFQLTVVLAVCWWFTRRDRKEFNVVRVLTMAALAIAVGSLPFLVAWCLFPGNWILLGLAVCAPIVPIYALAIVTMRKSLRQRGEKKPGENSSLHPPCKSKG